MVESGKYLGFENRASSLVMFPFEASFQTNGILRLDPGEWTRYGLLEQAKAEQEAGPRAGTQRFSVSTAVPVK